MTEQENKNFLALREKHSKITFNSFKSKLEDKELSISFSFKLEPDIIFSPEIKIKLLEEPKISKKRIDYLAFNLGILELISYWKAACPKTVEINCGVLTEDQKRWWKKLYLLGLGEFFYLNKIDFSSPDFLEITSTEDLLTLRGDSPSHLSGAMILASGGRDSCLTLDILKKENPLEKTAFVLNPTKSTLLSLKESNIEKLIIATRTIDPKLLELNKSSYLNGHTPFSAYLAMLSTLVAEVAGLKHIIVSNEKTASEANTSFKNLPINHQYSKSIEFERDFRDYSKNELKSNTNYFSLLRKFSDKEIGEKFGKLERFHEIFRSCNVGQKSNSWCNSCPKCLSVFLSLAPIIGIEKTSKIFGINIIEDPKNLNYLKELLGLDGIKPFECVGGINEARASLNTILKTSPNKSLKHLVELKEELENAPNIENLYQTTIEEHFIPNEFEKLL